MFRNGRQLGTVTALELAEPHSDYLSALGPTLLRFFLDRGVLLRPLGNTIRSEEHTSELQSLMRISYAVFCLKKKKQSTTQQLYQKKKVKKTPHTTNKNKHTE